MVKKRNLSKKKNVVRLVLFGIFSLILYAIIFTNQDIVTEYFTKGQWYAVLPIITVFIFSFVHGIFTNEFWFILGIDEAKKNK